MIFNKRYSPQGHALLSASKPHWTNYDDEKLDRYFDSAMAAQRGTDMHELAYRAIRLGVRLSVRHNRNIATYVNDAIGYRMTPEQLLWYSENCYGTADTICFRRNKLRIHDLKNGITRTTFRQLEVYTALFCLEYGMSPFEIEIELRIYQNDEVKVYVPEPADILQIMNTIERFDLRIEERRKEA